MRIYSITWHLLMYFLLTSCCMASHLQKVLKMVPCMSANDEFDFKSTDTLRSCLQIFRLISSIDLPYILTLKEDYEWALAGETRGSGAGGWVRASLVSLGADIVQILMHVVDGPLFNLYWESRSTNLAFLRFSFFPLSVKSSNYKIFCLILKFKCTLLTYLITNILVSISLLV